MDRDDERKDGEAKGLADISVKRRNFLKTLLVLGGGGIAYTAPLVKALEGRAEAQTSNVINVTLPASYDVDEPSLVFDIELLDGSGATASIAFHAVGGVTLNPTTNPNVAQVSLDTLNLTSNDANPLLGLGFDAGLITASVGTNTDIGTLDLTTGTIAEHDFGLGINFERNYSPWSTVVTPTAALIIQQATTVAASSLRHSAARATTGTTSSGKCTKKNDVTVPLPGGPGRPKPLPPGRGKGKIGVGMKPKKKAVPVLQDQIEKAPAQ